MATVFSVVLGPVKSFMTASSAAFGLGSDSEDCRVRVVEVVLAPEVVGVPLLPMQPLSNADPPSAAPPSRSPRRLSRAADSSVGVGMVNGFMWFSFERGWEVAAIRTGCRWLR
jgi:hypothetical protein